MSFAHLWQSAIARNPLCVGIDPAPATLEAWELEDTPEGLASFATTMLEQCHMEVWCVKPQVAFFERHGAAGIAVLESVHRIAQDLGMVVITDAKRGDIGSTMDGYADAYLNPDRPLATDALTVSPYLGTDSLNSVFKAAEKYGTGFFALALTSNPSGPQVQHAQNAGTAVAAQVVEAVHNFNESVGVPLGGLVVGATIGDAARKLGIDLGAFNGPILSPGYGAQGATVEDLHTVFGRAFDNVFVNVSRGISNSGPQKIKHHIRTISSEIRGDAL